MCVFGGDAERGVGGAAGEGLLVAESRGEIVEVVVPGDMEKGRGRGDGGDAVKGVEEGLGSGQVPIPGRGSFGGVEESRSGSAGICWLKGIDR